VKKFILFLTIIVGSPMLGHSATNEDFCSDMPWILYEGKLSKSITDQRKATSYVKTEKVIMGDIVFFKGVERFGCPQGISGFVTEVRPGAIVFATFAAKPREQVILFPRKESKKGNFWYDLAPEFRTLNPETDPPRPGDKDYMPNNQVHSDAAENPPRR
jgi:hypothetical protein